MTSLIPANLVIVELMIICPFLTSNIVFCSMAAVLVVAAEAVSFDEVVEIYFGVISGEWQWN